MDDHQQAEESQDLWESMLPRVDLEFNPEDLKKHRKMVLAEGPEEVENSERSTASKNEDDD